MSFQRLNVMGAILFLLLSLQFLQNVLALDCIQCDRRGTWYSPEESERHVAKCQSGLIEATRCPNSSHTHCISSYYREGASSMITVTERRCGVREDIIGCTLYKSSRRIRRHFIGGSDQNSHRRRDAALFVEVCVDGCEGDGCVSGASSSSSLPSFFFFLLLFFFSAAKF